MALVLILTGETALAQAGTELAPEAVRTPEARPEEPPQPNPLSEDTGTPAPEGPQDESNAPADETVPQLIPPSDLPQPGNAANPEPDESQATDGSGNGTPADAPGSVPAQPAGPPMREVLTETPAELAACLTALDELRVTYERADALADPDTPDCGIANPLTVSEIASGVALDPPPTLRCEAALAAARWAADVALPLSRKLEGRGALTAIDQGTAYLCRPRADGELSEHAFGNALDVMGFRFESGDLIPVEPRAGEGTIEEAFQRAVRAGACLDFTTVLGPGQEDHEDHLHLDVKERDSGFRICQ